MKTTVQSFILAGHLGMEGVPVTVTAEHSDVPGWTFDAKIPPVRAKEAVVRLRSALAAVGREVRGAKIDVSTSRLAPAHDLPLALALAGATGGLGEVLVCGELGLDGSVRPVPGILQAVLVARSLKVAVLVPMECALEAFVAADGEVAVHAIRHLGEAIGPGAKSLRDTRILHSERAGKKHDGLTLGFETVRGQSRAALEAIVDAVAAREALALVGPPGVGKTMIARRIPELLPEFSREEQVEASRPYSALGLPMYDGLVPRAPFRAPHHTISAAALAGGGATPRPGEVHLATHGVLFLDEVEEFRPGALEALRGALDAMPAASRPLVVAASSPCLCGWRGSPLRECNCTEESVRRHGQRVQWARERLGVRREAALGSIGLQDMRSGDPWPTSAEVRAMVEARKEGGAK